MEPKKSTSSDSTSSLRTSRLPIITLQMETVLRFLESTTCLTGPQVSTRSFLDTKVKSSSIQVDLITDTTESMDIMDIMHITDITDITVNMAKESLFPIFQKPSTGESKVPLPQLKTKVAVVHAGLSPPLAPWKVLTSLRTRALSPFLNSNSLTAQKKTKMPDAKVDSWTMLSLMLRLMELRPRLNIHIREEMAGVPS